MKKNQGDQSQEVSLNLTPMVDVTFLLIVFFMVVIDFSSRSLEPVKLAEADSAQEKKEEDSEQILLNLGLAEQYRGKADEINFEEIKYWRIYFKGEEFTFDESDLRNLRGVIRPIARRNVSESEDGKHSEVPLILRADKRMPWALVREIIQQVNKQLDTPVYKMNIAAQLPQEQ